PAHLPSEYRQGYHHPASPPPRHRLTRIRYIATSSSNLPDKRITNRKRSAHERTGNLFLRTTAALPASGADNKSRAVMLPFALRNIQTVTERAVSIPDWRPATAHVGISDHVLFDWL